MNDLSILITAVIFSGITTSIFSIFFKLAHLTSEADK